MLSRLIKSIGKRAPSQGHTPPLPTPDISRVLRPQQPSASALQEETLLLTRQTSQLASSAEEAVASLSDEFEGWMRKDLAGLCAAWETAREPNAGAEAYRALYICAHNIRGAATSYGYPAASRLCGSLCTLLSGSQPGDNAALINLHVEACRAAVAAGPEGEGSASIADAVCDALERRVALKVSQAG